MQQMAVCSVFCCCPGTMFLASVCHFSSPGTEKINVKRDFSLSQPGVLLVGQKRHSFPFESYNIEKDGHKRILLYLRNSLGGSKSEELS